MRALAALPFGACLLVALAGPAPAQTPQDEGKALLEKAIKAHGGEKLLASVKAIHVKGKGDINTMGAKLPFTAEIFSQEPDRFKVVIDITVQNMNIQVIQCYDGKKGWMNVMGNTMDMPEDQFKEMKNQMHVDRVTNLVAAKEKGFKLSPLGESKVEGKDALGLLVTKEGERDVSLYFDKTTHLLVKAAYRAQDMGGAMEVAQEKFFQNYKKLDSGFQMFTKMIMRNDGNLLLDMEISDTRIVEKHDDSIFARP